MTSMTAPGGWSTAWASLGLEAPIRTLELLTEHWAQPYRKYHTQQHLAECLGLFDEYRHLAQHPGEVFIALWFHDAIYEMSRNDNEQVSADRARQTLLTFGACEDVANRVHALVMATRHDAMPATPDEALLVDIDLAILGAEPTRFAEYEMQIREEYGFVPDAVFREKRAEILGTFLARPFLFSTPELAQRFDAPARENLRRAIAALDAPPMRLRGELVTVGDMVAEDVPALIGVPAVQLRTADGRIVTITGLTRDEARAAAVHYGNQVSLSLTGR